MSPREFEAWAYDAPELETALPKELFLETISLDYADRGSVFTLQQKLAEFAQRDQELKCLCLTLPNLADVGMGTDTHNRIDQSLTEVKRRGTPLWWLSVNRCDECGQWWLMASEERINDVVFLRRLTDTVGEAIVQHDAWPIEFDRFSSLLELGRLRGHRWKFVDPISPALLQTAIDLAHEQPDLNTARLAELLQIDLSNANALADRVELEAPIRSPIRIIRSRPA
jgi:hypothetical protein